MKNHLTFKRVAIAGLGAVLLAAGAPALADPPSRIARLAYISGPVSFAAAGEDDWENAALNSTLIAGDRLWVDSGARDEVQVGAAALRMGGGTLVTLAEMDDRLTRLQLSQGRLNIRVRNVRPNEVFEIDTPNLALTIRQPGDYRIEVDPAGNATMVAVRRGQADVYGGGNAHRLGSGQAYRFGGSDLRGAQYARADLDEFDRWSAARDRRLEQSRAARYVSPNLVGYEDLDEQGAWRSVPDYGNVWMPANVGSDWAPYRDGHWSYVQPWGWTWVDNAPWGFAVSHYGRWARFPQGWGWVPGPRAASPVYAPALVAFISIGGGAYSHRERPVAWFPLAPREAYRPSYRASPGYVNSINITNTTFAHNRVPRHDKRAHYANRRVGGAVTAVPEIAFGRAQPVTRSALTLPAAALAGAAIADAAPPAPERGARASPGRRGNEGHQPPPGVMARQDQARTAQPPALRHAPTPMPPPAAAPAAQDDRRGRRDETRQARDQRPPPPPLARAPTPVPSAGPPAAVPVPPNDPTGRREDRRQGRDEPRTPSPPPLLHAPTPVPPFAAPDLPNDRSSRREERRDARPPPPPPLQHAPMPVTAPAPPAAAPVPQNDRGARREEIRQAREQQRQERPVPAAPAAVPAPPPPRPPEPAPLRHAPTPAPAPAPAPAAPAAPAPLRHAPTPAPAPAAPAAPAPLRHAPTPAPAAPAATRAPEPPKQDQARLAQAQQHAGQNGHGNEGKRGDKRERDRPEKD